MKGFTLLEVLIASTLTAVILTAVYGAYVANTDAIQAAREASRMQQTSRMIFDLLAKDVRCALGGDFLGVDGGMEGANLEVQGRPADRLGMLTSASHAGVEAVRTGLYRVFYEMAVNEQEEDGFILSRSQEMIVGEAASAGRQTYELTRMASGLDLRFLDAEGREHESWGGTEGQGGKLPSLVQVKLTLKGASGNERVFVTSLRPEAAGGPW